MSTSTVGTIFTGFLGNITSILDANLSAVLVVVAGLIGLGILIYYVRRWVGHK